jgi:hypothetical protein
MWKDMRVTLYDIFGYFLPGSVILGGFFLCWKACGGSQLLSGLQVWERSVLLVLGAYYLGHMAQGIGNGLEVFIGDPTKVILGRAGSGCESFRKIILGQKRWERIDEKVHTTAQGQFDQLMGLSKSASGEVKGDERAKWLYPCCAEVIGQLGHNELREMYEYREGFYRGSAIAFVLVAIVLIPTIACWKSHFSSVWLFWITLALTPLLSFLAAFLSLRRYGRFAESRVRSTLLGFLVLENHFSKGSASVNKMED